MGKFLREMLQETKKPVLQAPNLRELGTVSALCFLEFATMAPCSEIQGVPENVPFNQTRQTRFSPDSLCCFGLLLYPITELGEERIQG